ncbi:Hypothetical predicted protein [Podarcis lilfordi]|uniref:Uncharacterized protein n=1 Tax=Podarcis lilfordi TaxID=74358 RepID=A0AA35NWG6_9SAUR|nr:Hypothetical predicted protein [Podarcis lilfordi]
MVYFALFAVFHEVLRGLRERGACSSAESEATSLQWQIDAHPHNAKFLLDYDLSQNQKYFYTALRYLNSRSISIHATQDSCLIMTSVILFILKYFYATIHYLNLEQFTLHRCHSSTSTSSVLCEVKTLQVSAYIH